MITLEDWALIRRLASDGVPKAQIAARLGILRTTVIKAVNSEGPPRYERSPRPTSSRRSRRGSGRCWRSIH
ncbi:helix-turn-helix domain-containing protein [uncultured Microbacterium sp.]|uniref:helix-turn-helix domain-containing protein n=1 Tax=uncultured Microbacterium sp. TaxID=191216 RepID=UPI003440D663